jgi:regulatory protein
LGLLAVRSRSRHELQSRLLRAGFEAEEIEQVLEELESVGLVDDSQFAAQLVRDQAGRRLSGSRAIRSALWRSGVAPELAEAAAAEAEGGEEERALELATGRARRLGTLPPEAAYRRVLGVLLRRGYAPALARWVAQQAVSPDAVVED